MGNEPGRFMPVFNPPVPYKGYLPMGPTAGSSVIINGVVPTWCNRFAINLETDNNDIALHFNPRFEGTNQVIRNSCHHGAWGAEERHGPFPFYLGQPFEIQLLIEEHHYRISVNGVHFAEFRHRIPKDLVRKLGVEGEVQLTQIRFQPGAAPPIYNPPVPFNSHIQGGMAPGKMIRINGMPTYGASRFSINLVHGGGYFANADIAMHCDVRFNYGNAHNTVVRTHRHHGNWGNEERHASFFPFAVGSPFEIIIRCEHHKYMIAVNNQHMFEFQHRLHPLHSADHLAIEGNVQLSMIQFQ